MTEIEVKTLKAQLSLLKEISTIDRMILRCIQDTASSALDIIKPKRFYKEDQKTIELSISEFEEILKTLQKLSTDKGFEEINSWIKNQYILPKEEKLKILSLLQ